MTQWHPSDEQLIEYSAASCSSAMSIALATHLHFCPTCRRQVSEHEATAAVLFEQQPSAAVEADSFSRLMARIQTSPDAGAPAATKPVASAGDSFDLQHGQRCFGFWLRY